MAAKTTRITVETETLMIIRRAKVDLAWCPECSSKVETIALDSGSLGELATAAQVHEWLASNRLHQSQIDDGTTRICVRSLLHCFESGTSVTVETAINRKAEPRITNEPTDRRKLDQ